MTRYYTDEEIAVILAMDKELQPHVKEAKYQCRERILMLEAETGADRVAIKVNGEKVGAIGVKRGKPKFVMVPGHEREALDILDAMGLTELSPVKGWENHFSIIDGNVVSEDGEVVTAITYTEGTVTAAVTGCKPRDVAEAIGAKRLDDVASRMLYGGDGE